MKRKIFLGFMLSLTSIASASNLEKQCSNQAKEIVSSLRKNMIDYENVEIHMHLIEKNEIADDFFGGGRGYTFDFVKIYPPSILNPKGSAVPLYRVRLSNKESLNYCDKVEIKSL